jgi:2-methylcitrate dehydratase PrpD
VKDVFGAQFSARYSVGLAFIIGDNRIRAYQRHIPPFGRWKEVVAMARKVDIIHDKKRDSVLEDTGIFGYSVCEIKLKNGKMIKGESGWPKGFVGNPMTEEERLEKFYSQALMVISKDKADEIVDLSKRLEHLDDIRSIVKLMVH